MKKILYLIFAFSCFNATAQILKNCSICATQIIKNEQIKDLSIDEISFLMNDLFARKGYQFKDSEIGYYYGEKNWYKPVSDNSKIVYNATEKQNIKLFQNKTSELKTEREMLMSELKNFKKLILEDNKEALKTKYNFEKQSLEIEKSLKDVLNKINLDELNWFKNEAFYNVKIDNLNSTIGYEIFIDSGNIAFKYDFDGGTEKIDVNLYPSSYYVEFTYVWEFEWKNNQLKFVELIAAG